MAKEKKNKNVKASGISDLLKALRQERYAIDLRERDVQFACNHRRNGKLTIKKTKTDGVLKCRQCGAKIDLRYLDKVTSTKDAKSMIKKWKNQGFQFANLAKININEKNDKELLRKTAKAQRSIAWLVELFKVTMLKELANKSYKGKKGKKYNSNVIVTGGGASIWNRSN